MPKVALHSVHLKGFPAVFGGICSCDHVSTWNKARSVLSSLYPFFVYSNCCHDQITPTNAVFVRRLLRTRHFWPTLILRQYFNSGVTFLAFFSISQIEDIQIVHIQVGISSSSKLKQPDWINLVTKKSGIITSNKRKSQFLLQLSNAIKYSKVENNVSTWMDPIQIVLVSSADPIANIWIACWTNR